MSRLDVWNDILQPREGALSPEHAQYVLALDFSPKVHKRYQALAEKAQDGSLTKPETAELDQIISANSFLSLLKSKARLALKRKRRAA